MNLNNLKIDLHIHTNASDGTWSNVELLKNIYEKNIKIFSITDHDTITNSIKMISMVPDDLYFIVGVEITCTLDGKEFHILGYDFDIHNKALNNLLVFNRIQREESNKKVIQYAYDTNMLDTIENYSTYEYDKARGGWESLNYLYDNKVISNLKDYFQLAKSSNEFLVLKEPQEVIEIIKDAGGYAFLAHPSGYTNGSNLSIECLERFKNFGISGIECYSPYLKSLEDAAYYINFCKENDLMISAGSDCHGGFTNRDLGSPEVNLNQLDLRFIKI
ncbi:putative metal-dependent phosphoesterase TrpH [Natranaerovirga pectinivora]|uniref:Putative metal-dependent phosphoesterase TrpH n=1 Tax=Natranaerovirga pectinivora TaxID=682400 RepID=A0A4R3MSE9_9FIRM|nr:PHP domain-containing protein [Natranaerovirga pectinivora]TCT17158.1 putative metal-dependent phosphoesterase TrpH [Natranaerovirga pectinivora]